MTVVCPDCGCPADLQPGAGWFVGTDLVSCQFCGLTSVVPSPARDDEAPTRGRDDRE